MGEGCGGELGKGKEEVGRWGLKMGPGMGGREKGGKGARGKWGGIGVEKGIGYGRMGKIRASGGINLNKKKRAGEGIFFYFWLITFDSGLQFQNPLLRR